MNIALLASGKGSNVKNILSFFKENNDGNKICLIATNNPNSPVRDYALGYQTPSVLFTKQELNKEGYLIDLMESYQIDLVVLAGFLLMIPFDFIKNFKGKIINIHPSLLPKYGGKGMYGDHVHRAVLKNNESTSGITFHYVNENYDEGQIISQFEVSLSQEETLASLKHKIDVLEKKHYPLVISSILNE